MRERVERAIGAPFALVATVAYAGLVFVAGFAIGAVRGLLVVPRMGETAAVALEAPVMLAISWFASRCDTWLAFMHSKSKRAGPDWPRRADFIRDVPAVATTVARGV